MARLGVDPNDPIRKWETVTSTSTLKVELMEGNSVPRPGHNTNSLLEKPYSDTTHYNRRLFPFSLVGCRLYDTM